MSTLLKVAQMSGGTVALMSGGTYDSGTKVAASTIRFLIFKHFLRILKNKQFEILGKSWNPKFFLIFINNGW
jgi:hypothetical protein